MRTAVLLSLMFSSACADAPPAHRMPGSQPFAVADSLYRDGRAAEAAAAYRALRDSLAQTDDTAGLWNAQLWWAKSLLDQGRLDSARTALARAARLAGDEPEREGWTRWVRSILLDRQGRFDPALAEAEGVLELARAARDRELEAAAYNALGRIHSLRGRYREALEVHERLLALRRRDDSQPRSLALALNEIGIDYRHFGRFDDAARAYEESLAIYRELDDPDGIAMVLYNLANIRRDAGEEEKALELLTESLAVAQEIGHVRGLGLLHNNLAELYIRAGNVAGARSHVEHALEINRSAGLAYGEVQALENLGRIELGGDRTKASAALASARLLADSLGYGRERVSVRDAVARLALARGDVRTALRRAEEAVVIADSLGDPAARYQALEARAAAREAMGDPGALEAYLDAIDLLESWRGRLAMGDLRMGVAEPRLGAYEGAIRLLIAQGRVEQAFEVAERARARLLLELMAERGRRTDAASAPDSLRRRLRERYTALEGVPDPARATIEREIERLIAALDSVEIAVSRDHRATAAARHPRPITFRDAQETLTEAGRALLAYFWGDRHVYGWWITRRGVTATRLGPADSLAAQVQFLRGAIEDPSAEVDWRPAARRAFRDLVAPLGPAPAEEVVVLADGPLALLPLEVFIPDGGTVPWGAARRFRYGPSASVLAGLAREPPRHDWPRDVLAAGAPYADASEAAIATRTRNESLPPLPYAEVEARRVARLFPDARADLLIGRRASPERWLQSEPRRYRYLHFATHAIVSERRAEQTRLVLAGGTLDLPTIRRLPIRSELVTLSACETGIGRRVRGEGVIGLPHAFLAAGGRAVLVTLWRIEDRSAADFMIDFYRELRAGHPAGEALFRVRRTRMTSDDPGAAHPARWAPFVLVGGP